MKGYWRDPEATERAIGDGWLYTGDIGEFEAHGFITGLENGFVAFDYRGFHEELIRGRITVDNVRWAGELLGQLTRRQWSDAFRAGGFDDRLNAGRVTGEAVIGRRKRLVHERTHVIMRAFETNRRERRARRERIHTEERRNGEKRRPRMGSCSVGLHASV